MKNIQIIGILHVVGSFFGITFGGIIFPFTYYLIKKEEFKKKEVQIMYDIINFQLSYFLYFAISGVLVLVLIGIVGLIFFAVMFLINLALGLVCHLDNTRNNYILAIQFIKK